MTAVATEATLVDRVPKGLFIAGDWLSTPDTVAVEDPSTGEVLAEAPIRASRSDR